MCSRPENVGIIAMDIYFPKTAVSQSDLEKFDKVASGKYTIGLGQKNMAFVGDREDVISIALTGVQNFFEKFNISPKDIGRLEVGTETIIDKSKSVKTYLMQLFGDNTNVEGIDTLNACYGGTNALLNSVNWMESKAWDGRYALAVAADIAVYERGPARPSGGCAAVVMLIGPNAPIVLESGIRGSHMEHAYDFYKPVHGSEYPTVDGHVSIDCYLRSLDICYGHYKNKFRKAFNKEFSIDDADYIVCHSPFNKLVQKAMSRFMYNDFLSDPTKSMYSTALPFKDLPRETTYQHKDITALFANISAETYKSKVVPSILLPTELGNMYCASLYGGLMSLLDQKRNDLVGKRILLFSYGSGAASTLFSLKVNSPVSHIASTSNIGGRLIQRNFVHPEEFTKMLSQNEKRYSATTGYTPVQPIDSIFPGSFYLENIDENYRRTYKRAPKLIPAKL